MEQERGNAGYTPDRNSLTTEEKIGSLFQADSLLSVQYFETLRRRTLLEPEKRLMLAMLEDAIDSIQKNVLASDVRRSRLFQDAEEWILDVNGDWVFSFENVCETLGLSPAYVRQGVLRWMKNKLSKGRENRSWEQKKLAV